MGTLKILACSPLGPFEARYTTGITEVTGGFVNRGKRSLRVVFAKVPCDIALMLKCQLTPDGVAPSAR
jgi:hypothetical protein